MKIHGFAALVLVASAAFASVGIAAPKAGAKSGECRGVNMFEEFKTTDPLLASEIEANAKKIENANAILWRVEKDGVAPSYLFGTVHLTDERVTTLSQATKKALAESSTVALEIADLSPLAMSKAIAEAAKLAVYRNGESLKSKLSAENFKKAEQAVIRAGMPGATAQLFKPWVINMLLASSDCERRKIKSGSKVLDMQLADYGKANGKTVVGLETLDSQIEAMASIPMEDQLNILRSGLAFVERSNDLVETLLHFYLTRNLGATWPFQLALARKSGVTADVFDAFNTNLIVKRNETMRDAAMPLLQKGGAFVAVGALHLPGPSGLVTLFREADYRVTAID
jgi:uncharacterized protein